jgi:hypothetical protein
MGACANDSNGFGNAVSNDARRQVLGRCKPLALAATALVATLVPALRPMRVDPVLALRDE